MMLMNWGDMAITVVVDVLCNIFFLVENKIVSTKISHFETIFERIQRLRHTIIVIYLIHQCIMHIITILNLTTTAEDILREIEAHV